MNWKLTVLACAISALAGAAAYYKLATPQVVVKTEVVERVVNRDVVRHVVTTKSPDGTVKRETTTTDKSKEAVASTTKVEAKNAPQWLVGALYTSEHNYGALVGKRLVGPIFVTLQASQNRTVAIGLLIEF